MATAPPETDGAARWSGGGSRLWRCFSCSLFLVLPLFTVFSEALSRDWART